MFRMIKRLFLLLLVAAIAAGAYLFYSIGAPYGSFDKEVFVDIPSGTSTRGIARILTENGVVRSEWTFLAARFVQPEARLKAGEYRFTTLASALEVYRRVGRGDSYFQELRVPEGSNQFDIAAALEQLGVIKATDFLKVSMSPALIRDLDPKAPSLEGFLFPATYRVTRHSTAQQMAKDMTDRFRRTWKELAKPGVSVHRTVTLASLVEKETGVASDRPTVASVFENRLEKRMSLDCDPSTIYAAMLENRYRGTIYRSDLNSTNAYNTYKHAGLPPGPIANPGAAALKAVLTPANTDYLYFVAEPGGSGKHKFSATLEQHNAAVQVYRNGLKR